MNPNARRTDAARVLRRVARRLARYGWLPATSGNLSLLVGRDPLQIAITRSGADKARLRDDDVIVWADGEVVAGTGRPSAESAVHAAIYRATGAGAVIHVHTVTNNLASDLAGPDGIIPLAGNELQKALGFWGEEDVVNLPVLANDPDLARLADDAACRIVQGVPGLLIRRHGLYAFGADAAEALAHTEAFEFLLEWRWRLEARYTERYAEVRPDRREKHGNGS